MGKILDDSELAVFDCINSDLNELAGVRVNFYGYDPHSDDNIVRTDPLYGEPTERCFDGPFSVWAIVTYPDYQPLAEESGFGREWDSIVTISRLHLDQVSAPYPSEGDVVEMWRTPFHDAWSMGEGLYFDVIKSLHDGHINDTPTFTQFKISLKRRSQFGAERRLTTP